MAIAPNKVVTMNFTLKDDEENILDTTESGGPFSYLSGNDMVLPKLEEAVSGMLIGTKKTLSLQLQMVMAIIMSKLCRLLEEKIFRRILNFM